MYTSSQIKVISRQVQRADEGKSRKQEKYMYVWAQVDRGADKPVLARVSTRYKHYILELTIGAVRDERYIETRLLCHFYPISSLVTITIKRISHILLVYHRCGHTHIPYSVNSVYKWNVFVSRSIQEGLRCTCYLGESVITRRRRALSSRRCVSDTFYSRLLYFA